MSAKKVYVATVSIDLEMFVVAENENDAERVAEHHWEDELRNNLHSPFITVGEADVSCATEDSIPWGDAEDKTVGEFIVEQVEREREEEERRRIEANQLKLPFGGA